MYLYEVSLSIEGTVSRWSVPSADRNLQRNRVLDSLVLSRLHNSINRPNLLIYSSVDAQRPIVASLFSRSTIVNSIIEFWNAILREPYGHACFAQLVDQLLTIHDSSRIALELSLSKVKPYDLDSFEQLLERIEKFNEDQESEVLVQDNLGRFVSIDKACKNNFESGVGRSVTSIEAFIETNSADRGSGEKRLVGRDFPVTDFRSSLQGVSEFFQRWLYWLGEEGLNPAMVDRIYIHSHLRNLLPACWEELRRYSFSADQIRLPQWAGAANGLSSYLEFMMSDVQRAVFFYFPINGRCHMAYLVRNP